MAVEKVINCSKVGMTHVIGKGGSNIKRIQADSGAKVETKVDDEDNKKAIVTVTAEDEDSLNKAVKEIEQILHEQEEPDYEGPEGGKLRAKADAHAKERSRLMELADKQFADGDKSAGHETMAKAKEEGELMKSTSAEAARVILNYRNGDKPDSYLDLHGLRTAEAEEFTTERLDALEKKEEGTNLTLIPGAGHHSAPGKVALKPAVQELLKKRGIEFEDIDAGSIMAKVKGTKGEYAHEGEEGGDSGAAGGAAAAGGASSEPTSNDNKADDEKKKEGGEEKKEEEKKEKGGCCIVM